MDLMKMMKQAQEMQSKLQSAQSELETVLVCGTSGGGMVSVTLSAKGALKAVSIDPSLLKPEEKDIVEDLLIAAHEDARRKADEAAAEKMKSITAGLPLPPGMKLPF